MSELLRGHGVSAKECSQASSVEWPEQIRSRIIKQGIRFVCGRTSDVPTTVADDIRLTAAAPRWLWLKLLGAFGQKSLVAKSGLGYPFVAI